MKSFIQCLALSATLVAGCQAALPLHAMRQPLFAVDQQGAAATMPVAASPSTTAGKLTVSFKGDLAQWTRRVLATVADVEKVVVMVRPAGTAELSQTVPKAAIAVVSRKMV